MLWACTLALTTRHTVTRFAMLFCKRLKLLFVLWSSFLCDLCIIQCKVLRNCNAHRTSFHAVTTGRARNLRRFMNDIDHLSKQHLFFLLRQRLELLHISAVVLHLLQIRHAAEYNHHILWQALKL